MTSSQPRGRSSRRKPTGSREPDSLATRLTGTAQLTRFILRLDRVRIAVWVLSIVGLVAITVASIKGLYPTQASLDQAAAASEGNAAAIAFNGPAQGLRTVGGEVAFQAGAFGMVLVALMSLFMCGALTRGEEEAGRLELVRSLPVGRYAPIAATVLVVTAMNIAVAVLSAASLVAQGLPVAGSAALGLSYLLLGLLFGAGAILAAQVTENTRAVYGGTGACLAAAYVLRAVGDAGDGKVSWLSPIGWAQKTRPFAGERWWPFLLLVAAIGVLVGFTAYLSTRRDLGAGLVAPRPGRPRAAQSLGHPAGLAFRLQRGSLVGWSLGILVAGIAYGSLTTSIQQFVSNNKELADMMARAGGANLVDSYLATAFRIMALIGAGFAVQSVGRLRSEETALRAEPVLATPVSRWRWAWSHLVIAFSGSVVVLVVGGLGAGLAYAFTGGGPGVVPKLLLAAVVYAPAMWVLVGITTALQGFAPRAIVGSWVFLAACLVVGFLGEVLKLSDAVRRISPFEDVPQLPAKALAPMPLVLLTGLAAALTLAGLLALRRRDIA